MSNSRILIFIVAYNHEKTIQSVLSRIPETLPASGTEVLIIDDASDDRTFDISTEYPENRDFPFKLTVLYNPVNQGYGGNQKIGYHYAIEQDFDVVALVHGDGQYAPEKLPDLVAPIIAGEADAVLGSRMIEKGDALKGGMPYYKYFGNKILTAYQNLFLGARLSEFHSGYRAYSVPALKKLPFDLNTNDFHFDTEIIIQLMLADMRIKEIPIPTYYGDEICHVDGLKYAWDVAKSTVVGAFQKRGVFYERKFDIEAEKSKEGLYLPKLGYESSHTKALGAVKDGTRVLDLGCASGWVGKALKEKGCHVVGIDSGDASPDGVDEYIRADLNTDALPVRLQEFDTVLMLDVIEHLTDPEAFVLRLADEARKNPQTEIVITTGNVGFFVVRLMLLIGQFNYGKRGILDRTHTRLFTFNSLRRLFTQRGFETVETSGIPAPYPLAIGNNLVGRALVRVNSWLIHLSRGLFSYQIFMRLKPLPSLTWLLNEAKKHRR